MKIRIELSDRTRFILKYAWRAIFSLLCIFLLAVLFKELFFDLNPEYWIDKFYSNPTVIYLIYVGSEVFFGIFPPELFMIWAMNKGDLIHYVVNITFFTSVSLVAGHLAYWLGRLMNKIFSRKLFKRKLFVKYLPFVRKFGGLLIVIAAMTPLPWSTISFVMGAINYRYQKFTYYSLSRILRFVLTSYLVYHSIKLFF